MLTLESALTGAVASAMANIAVYPLDLSKTIIQSQVSPSSSEDSNEGKVLPNRRYKNVVDCMINIFKEKGILGLYQGMTVTTVATFVQNFVYFFWYTFIRKSYMKHKLLGLQSLKSRDGPITPSTIEELVLGVAAASISQLFTSPMAVVATRQQTVHSAESAKFTNVVKDIYRENNGDITAFWKGLRTGLALTINPSITYASFQRLKEVFFHDHSNDAGSLSAVQNFVLGVLSKMISTLVTQPLIVAKAMLQSAGSKFTTFQEALLYLYKNEGLKSLWKGVLPQLTKGVIVQGLLFAFRGELTKSLKRLIFLYSSFFLKYNGQRKLAST
ncbi:CEI_1a_G0056000.mRNA.1.CDS.1 [Saccharomyces cerevisiae]|nr:CEI_1a_G0056000.mRNA.1.CDS.1 [Saccharomyces cerevisiae]CAI7486310.1 CEI_1a_G0056000.mRNA.1.CDS.1 [Saccharomyces cerevisiae]